MRWSSTIRLVSASYISEDYGLSPDGLAPEQRKILMQEIEVFVNMSELEQRVQLSGQLPSVESYQRRRMGTSAVGVCLAIQEWVSLPHSRLSSD